MKKLLLFFSILVISFTSYGQRRPTVHIHDGIFTSTNFTSERINGISISSSFDIYLTQGSSTSATVSVPSRYKDLLIFDLSSGVLRVGWKKGSNISRSKSDQLKLVIVCSSLDYIRLSGACDLYIGSAITSNSPSFEMRISGSCDVKVSHPMTINAANSYFGISGACDFEGSTINLGGSATISLSGSTDFKAAINSSKDLQLEASGASDASISGKVSTLNVRASGSSGIKASTLNATSAKVSASGASDVSLGNMQYLTVSASGSASVEYKGNPQIKASTSGGASIERD